MAFGTFHAVLDETTGELLVRGGGVANSNDVITISHSDTQITVSVDVGNDVPGTGALPGAGNLPAYVTTFDSADVTSIQIDAGDGNDTIRIESIQSGIPITIDAGVGNDTIHLAEAGDNLDVIDSNITVNGGAGTDIVRFFDTNNPFFDTFLISNSSIRTAFPAVTYSALETIILNAGTQRRSDFQNGHAQRRLSHRGDGDAQRQHRQQHDQRCRRQLRREHDRQRRRGQR